jgi:hypothetical protein
MPIRSTVGAPWSPWMRTISSHVAFLIIVITSSWTSSPSYSSSKVFIGSTSSTSSWSLKVSIHPKCCSVQPVFKCIQCSTLIGSMCGRYTKLKMYCIWYCRIFMHNGALSWPMPMDSKNLTILNCWCCLDPRKSMIWGGVMEW